MVETSRTTTPCTVFDASVCNDVLASLLERTLCNYAVKFKYSRKLNKQKDRKLEILKIQTWWKFEKLITHLVLIELAMFVLPFTFALEGHDYKTDEYVDHEECNDDYVDNVVSCDYRPEVIDWTVILAIGIDRYVQEAVKRIKKIMRTGSWIFSYFINFAYAMCKVSFLYIAFLNFTTFFSMRK